MFLKAQDRISCATHFYGALSALILTFCYLLKGFIENTDPVIVFSACVFSLSAVLLYSASSIYHFVSIQKKAHRILRKLDHSMIFVLIAGSYTPFVLPYFERTEALIFLGILWFVAIGGILMKIFWIDAPRIATTLLYLLMGWAAVFYLPAFVQNLSTGCMILVVSGGIFYSIGGIIYMMKKPNFTHLFGFHELFHCFILAGTLMHALAVYFCVF